jgi:hypothetical protein
MCGCVSWKTDEKIAKMTYLDGNSPLSRKWTTYIEQYFPVKSSVGVDK